MSVKGGGVIHELKCVQPFFSAVKNGKKNFEVRKNDREFMVGDILWLREYNPSITQNNGYTGEGFFRDIIYILKDIDYPEGVQSGYCILGIK
jgi:hypothetical protein